MKLKPALLILVATILLLAIPLARPAQALASRTWVSGAGSDSNNCSRAFPCATFATALAATAAGGEIDCVDAGSFDVVTITKAITIDCGSGETGAVGSIILSTGQNAITVQAGANDVVTVRRLTINGLQGTGFGGSVGVELLSGKSLELNNVNIMHVFTGLYVEPSGSSSLYVVNSHFSDNGTSTGGAGHIFVFPGTGAGLLNIVLRNVQMIGGNAGFVISNSAPTTIHASIEDTLAAGGAGMGFSAGTQNGRVTMAIEHSVAANNGTIGVQAYGSNTEVHLGTSLIYGNGTGVSATNGALLLSYKNNQIRMNGANGTPVTADTLD